MVLVSTQPLTEMSTRNIPGGKGRPAYKADNLTAICEPIVDKMWEPHISQLYGHPWPLTGMGFTFTFNQLTQSDLLDNFTTHDYVLLMTITKKVVFSITIFTALLRNVFQQWMFLCFRAHVLAG
jgi:hypothetical protein